LGQGHSHSLKEIEAEGTVCGEKPAAAVRGSRPPETCLYL